GGARLGLDFQQRAALEIDAEVQSVGEEQRDRDNRQRRRNRETDAAETREVEMRIVRDDPQRRQPAEATDDRQHDNEGAQPQENEMCHERFRLIKWARFAAASTVPSSQQSAGSA